MRFDQLNRRAFIDFFGWAMVLPLAAHAQQTMRGVAVIMVTRETDALGQGRLKAFLQALEKFGWIDGRNVRIDIRWAGDSPDRMREIVAEIMALKPDVILANGTPAVASTEARERVHSNCIHDSERAGRARLHRKYGAARRKYHGLQSGRILRCWEDGGDFQGNGTDACSRRADVNPETYAFYDTYLDRFQAEARWPMQMTRAAVRVPADIDAAIASIAAQPDGGLVVLPDAFNAANQATIRVALERHRLPHIVPWVQFVSAGGLMSYGPDLVDIFRRSAEYVDRILEGSEPRRASGPGADQVRTRDQPQDREDTRPLSAADAACHRRRGDRIEHAIAHVACRGA